MERDLLRPSDLSGNLGVTTGRVYQLLKEGVIPSVRIGGAIRIPRAAWDTWLAAQSEKAKAGTAR